MHVKEQGPWDHKKKNGKKMAVIVSQGRRNREPWQVPGLTIVWKPTYFVKEPSEKSCVIVYWEPPQPTHQNGRFSTISSQLRFRLYLNWFKSYDTKYKYIFLDLATHEMINGRF